jgi:hypothetical protein
VGNQRNTISTLAITARIALPCPNAFHAVLGAVELIGFNAFPISLNYNVRRTHELSVVMREGLHRAPPQTLHTRTSMRHSRPRARQRHM